MVDKVQGSRFQSNSNSTSQTKKKADRAPNKPEQRASVESQAAVVQSGDSKVSKVLKGLNEAVDYSGLAVRSLNQITDSGSADGAEANSVSEFSKDLGQLRDDIEDVLSTLRQRADQADVMRENLSAADTKADDLDRTFEAAKDQAEKVGSSTSLADAHQGLTAERVFELLRD